MVPTELLRNKCSPEAAPLCTAARIVALTLPWAPEALGQEQNVHNLMSGQEAGRWPEASKAPGRWFLSSWLGMSNLDRGIKQALHLLPEGRKRAGCR